MINRVGRSPWLTPNFETWNPGSGLFNDDGQLLGVITYQAAPFFRDLDPQPPGDRAAVVTRSDVIGSHWEALTAGKHLDQLRLKAADRGEPKIDQTPPVENPSQRQLEDGRVKARAASIRLRRAGSVDPNAGSSGVVVSPEGLIISCAHHFLLPGDELTITFMDGREVKGKLLGTNWVTDVSVAQITEQGTWPFTQLGSSLTLAEGDRCFTVGYPAPRLPNRRVAHRKITERQTRIVKTSDQLDCLITAAGERIGGESGGGLFDMQGRVVGIGESVTNGNTHHVRVEVIKRQWDDLTAKNGRREEGE